ncbi:MAG: carbohydrate kinase family protein [Patescibacteria group bacterium]|jgi:adenosine kinase
MKILVSGSLAHDKIMNFPGYFKDHILPEKIHSLNVSFLVENLNENFGGTAGNIAYNLALLGEQPVILAAAGNDFDNYRDWLENNKVDVTNIKTVEDEKTAFANIMTDQADNQLTAFYPGAMKYSGGDIPDELLQDSLAIISPGYIEDMKKYPAIYRENNIPFIFDPGQQIPALGGEDLKNGINGAKVLMSNDYELDLIIKKTGWDENKILEKAEIIVTTLGEKGSQIKTKDSGFSVPPAKPENTSDPTGAGDAYRAGFIKGLAEGWPLEICGRFAGVISCYTVEKYGTQTHKFNLEEAAKRYEDNFNDQLPL